MHQKRSTVSKKVPIPRKGTAYVARPLSHLDDSITVLAAVRDMLKLARTTREVKYLIHNKLLKINGREVKDYRESLKLFNILEAGKNYVLSLTLHGRFSLHETKEKNRLCKVINKKLLSGKKIQLNLHDGSNILSEDKIQTNDSVYLDSAGKISKHVSFEKGKPCFVISGKYIGRNGSIKSVGGKVSVSLDDSSVELPKECVIVQ